MEVPPGFEPGHKGFAGLCLTAWLRYRIKLKIKGVGINHTHNNWSGLRGSNSLPPPWQGGALPDELNPHILVPPVGIEPTTRGFSVHCSTD